MKVTFELRESDLGHFRKAMRKAKRLVRDAEDSDIIHAAEAVIRQIVDSELPEFVSTRLSLLQLMTRMVRDDEWALAAKERNRVLCALAYFADPEDIIPDHIPGIGFLDDAIMIELVFRELRHELDGYRDFCAFREDFYTQHPNATREQREWKLGNRREALHERMKRRREKELAQGNLGVSPIW